MAVKPESAIVKSILAYLANRQITAWRMNTGGATYQRKDGGRRFVPFGVPGLPDIIAIVNGLFFGIEVKTSTGRLSENQKRMAETIEAAGGRCILARSVEDVAAALAETDPQ